MKIPSWTTEVERNVLAELAHDVPYKGLIVEVGALYGGTTQVLAEANLKAEIISIDEFSWTPEGYLTANKERFLENMKEVGIENVSVIVEDSRVVGKRWDRRIELLWIDGGHSYEFVFSDLMKFGPHAKVIALHDYGNPVWPTIQKAVDDFLKKHPEFFVANVVDTVAVLIRR